MSAGGFLVVGICGKARAGKDSIARVMESEGDFFRIALADGVKSALNDLDGPTWDFRKERGSHGYTERKAAQEIGTECREDAGDPEHWVNHALIKIRYATKYHPVPRRRFVIPDIRFGFEVETLARRIRAMGGEFVCWRVVRSGVAAIPEAMHKSEREEAQISADLVIHNYGGKRYLANCVRKAMDTLPRLVETTCAASAGKVDVAIELPSPAEAATEVYPDPAPEEITAPSPYLAGAVRSCQGTIGELLATSLRLGGDGASLSGDWTSSSLVVIDPVPSHSAKLWVLANRWRGDRRPVLYLSGPMTGLPDLNFPAFNAAAAKLRSLSFPVLNPADFGDDGRPWSEHLSRDLFLVGQANILVQLPGWEQSNGASLEFSVAQKLGKAVLSYADTEVFARML